MPIFVPDIVSERGKVDAKRHREKHREAIKKNLPQIIADESIITSKKGKIVKVPLKKIDIPYFRAGRGKKSFGLGQGKGEPGDIIGQKPGNGKPGQAGSEPGEDYLEAEVELEELIELMLEDLGLPRLEDKEIEKLIVDLGFKVRGRTKSGPWSMLDTKRTAKEGIRRFWGVLNSLCQETGKDELACYDALKKSEGSVEDALDLLKDPNFKAEAKEIEPFPIFEVEDLVFYKIEENLKFQSNAVIIAMMDVSVSMTDIKKYFARSILFWLTNFLRKIYENVEIRFITHHTIAKIVDEESFFKTGESGGTFCYTAYELAGSLVESQYPANQWNVYIWHFSDGEDFDSDRTIEEMKKLFSKKINMIGYGEIQPDITSAAGMSDLMEAIKTNFDVEEKERGDLEIVIGKEMPFLGALITKREHILATLKEFLDKRRWPNK